MKPDTNARAILAAVIIATLILAALSYLLPGTLAAYLFPGISRINATQSDTSGAYGPFHRKVPRLRQVRLQTV